MKTLDILNTIKNTALQSEFVKSSFVGDAYDVWQNNTVQYGSLVVSLENIARNEGYTTYGLILYYGDRLISDDSNEYEIYDDTNLVLTNLLNKLEEVGDIQEPYTIELFKQKFSDVLAGGYVRFSMNVTGEIGACFMEDYEPQPVAPSKIVFEDGMKMAYWDGNLFNDMSKYDISHMTTMNGMFLGVSLPEYPNDIIDLSPWNLSKIKDTSGMFRECSVGEIHGLNHTGNITNMEYMFYECTSLEKVDDFDTTNCTNMSYMFQYCLNLLTAPSIGENNVTSMHYMFSGCHSLKEISSLYTSECKDMSNTFSGCTNLVTITQLDAQNVEKLVSRTFINCNNLTNFGGLKDIGKAFTNEYDAVYHNFSLSTCTKLTHDSLMNVVNGLWDMTKTEVTNVTLRLSTESKALLSDEEKSMITNKGWTLQ